jgi:hypothetical protein
MKNTNSTNPILPAYYLFKNTILIETKANAINKAAFTIAKPEAISQNENVFSPPNVDPIFTDMVQEPAPGE